MQLTDTRGTAFLVNTKSVVYAKTRGSGATLLLSRGNQVVDVEETVAEVVTAADSDLTAFTAISGDVVGSVAINPDYIVSVSSYANGTQSQIVLLDDNENTTRVCVVVSTDFADMDEILNPAPPAGSLGYDVYAATLTQVESESITAGSLVVGWQYLINSYVAGDDFSNIADVIYGNINENSCIFRATGTTPTDYSNGSQLLYYQHIESPVILGSNTVGAIVWEYDPVNGWYTGTLNGAFTTDGKTVCFTSFGISESERVSEFEVIDTNTVRLEFGLSAISGSVSLEIRIYP